MQPIAFFMRGLLFPIKCISNDRRMKITKNMPKITHLREYTFSQFTLKNLQFSLNCKID